MHKKMLYLIFWGLLNSAHLLSSVKFNTVSFGPGHKSSNTHIVSNACIYVRICAGPI